MSRKSHELHDLQSDREEGFSCEWKPGQDHGAGHNHGICVGNKSILYKFLSNYTWQGVETEAYKPEGGNFANIVRKVIIGNKGESCQFEVRYFEISEGGFSSLEKHEHEHVVICIRGEGQVLMGKEVYDIHFLDTAYISPDTPHQFINRNKEPFGFFCIVDRERDIPQELG